MPDLNGSDQMIRSMENPKAWLGGAAIVATMIGILGWANSVDVKDETIRMARMSQSHIIISIR
jgi:hypothetical protein